MQNIRIFFVYILTSKSVKYLSIAGKYEDVQMKALEKMLELLSNIEWKEQRGYTTTKKPFQKGLICAIRSTIALFNEMKTEGVKYILTKRYTFLRNMRWSGFRT